MVRRDRLDHFSRGLVGNGMRDIPQAEHPNLIYDRQSPDLLVLHQACSISWAVAVPAPNDAFRHDISGREL